MKFAAPMIAAALLAGCQQTPENAEQAGARVDAAATGAKTAAQAAYDRVNQRMHEGMAQIDVNPDTAFMRGMIAHHQGAIEMSEVALEYGEDPKVREMAQRIIAAQKGEIAEMEAWLAARGAPTAAPGATAPAMDHSNH